MMPHLPISESTEQMLVAAMLHFLWQGLALWLAAVCILHISPIRTAQTRYAFYGGLLLLLAICPPLTWLVGSGGQVTASVDSVDVRRQADNGAVFEATTNGFARLSDRPSAIVQADSPLEVLKDWLHHQRPSGHQVSMLCSDYQRELSAAAVALFARWCQENFFQYMGQHYGLDRLIEYGTQALPETTMVVNPAWRQQDQAVRRERALLMRQQVRFAALSLPPEASPEVAAEFEKEKGKLLGQIQQHQTTLTELKAHRKEKAKHIALKDLPEKERFRQLAPTKKQFVDTIKLIAYRAETALVQVLREKLQREDDARALVRQIFDSAVDLSPDQQQKTLTVRLHRLSTPAHDEILRHLCVELTDSETAFPGTELRLIFEPIGTNQLPRDQES